MLAFLELRWQREQTGSVWKRGAEGGRKTDIVRPHGCADAVRDGKDEADERDALHQRGDEAKHWGADKLSKCPPSTGKRAGRTAVANLALGHKELDLERPAGGRERQSPASAKSFAPSRVIRHFLGSKVLQATWTVSAGPRGEASRGESTHGSVQRPAERERADGAQHAQAQPRDEAKRREKDWVHVRQRFGARGGKGAKEGAPLSRTMRTSGLESWLYQACFSPARLARSMGGTRHSSV